MAEERTPLGGEEFLAVVGSPAVEHALWTHIAVDGEWMDILVESDLSAVLGVAVMPQN